MSKGGLYLLSLGLVCPLVSWLSLGCAVFSARSSARGVSAVFIPFIGPALLTAFILIEGYPVWAIPIVWILDIGTVAFCAAIPALVAEWWRYSSFTQLVAMEGRSGIERVRLTLHRSGHYLLEKFWDRDGLGITALGEPGKFSSEEHDFALVSHLGLHRRLRRTGPTTFLVEEKEEQNPEWHNHSIDGWSLAADRVLQA